LSVKGILFDKDDTLIDLTEFWREPVERLARFLSRSCGRESDEDLIARLEASAGFAHGKIIPESPVVAGTNRDIMNSCEQVLTSSGVSFDSALFDAGLKYIAQACIQYGNIVPKADFASVLRRLKNQGIIIGVATSDEHDPTMRCLRSLHIEQYIDVVLSADCALRSKPSPDMAREFCRRCGLLPSEVIMVGDSANDMLFAKNSGLKGIWFANGSDTRSLPPGTVFVLKAPEELLKLTGGREN